MLSPVIPGPSNGCPMDYPALLSPLDTQTGNTPGANLPVLLVAILLLLIVFQKTRLCCQYQKLGLHRGVGWDTPGSIKPMNDQNIPKGSCFSPFPTRVTLFSRFCYKRSRHADKARSPHVATQCQAQLQVQLRSGHWAAWVPRGEPARRGSQPQAAEIRSR